MIRLVSVADDSAAIMRQATIFVQEKYGSDILTDNVLRFLSARENERMPIVAMCSKSRHIDGPNRPAASLSSARALRLDLHTAETPLATAFSSLTFADAALQDILMENGVLNLYAIVRKNKTAPARGTSWAKKLSLRRPLIGSPARRLLNLSVAWHCSCPP